MAVDGGARNGTTAERRAAAAISSQYAPTAAQVAKAATIGASVYLIVSGGCAVAAATAVTGKLVGGATIAVGVATVGSGVNM